MPVHARRPITFTATATEWGRVEFDVDRVGTFTLSFGAGGYPHDCDEQRLEVAYGRWEDDLIAGRARELDDAPVVYGIQLVGGSTFTPDDALAHAGESESSWAGWLTVHRSQAGHYERVPWATLERVAFIVARLVEAFLERGDVDELLAAHRAHQAPSRIARHEDNLRRVKAELDEWEHRKATEEAHLQRQRALLELADPSDEPRTSVDAPAWRDYQSAATRDGEAFLIATVGASRPR